MQIHDQIKRKIEDVFKPQTFDIINESHLHSHSKNTESHFKLIIVSTLFTSLSLIERHQEVYKTLSEEVKNIHALSLKLYSPEEWENNNRPPKSPRCIKS